MSQSPPKDTAGSSSMSIVIKAKKSCPVILLLVRWTNWLCRASASKRSGGNVPANFSLIFPANCLGSRFIVMRIALLDDVICAKHIVRDVLMMSKTSDHAQFPGHAFVSLMHMGWRPRASCIGQGFLAHRGAHFVTHPFGCQLLQLGGQGEPPLAPRAS